MNKLAIVLLVSAETIASVTWESSIAGNGLNLEVVDEKSNGIQSQIYAEKDATELIIGTTDHNGKLTDKNYQCGGDRNLLAKPIHRNYFDSPLRPCISPQKRLVSSRLTPNGRLAFSGFSKSFATKSGDVGQVTYKAAIETVEYDGVDAAIAGWKANTATSKEAAKNLFAGSKCVFDFNVDVSKSKFLLLGDKWKEVGVVDEPASDLMLLTDNDIIRYLGDEATSLALPDKHIIKTNNGVVLATKSSCGEARETAKNVGEAVKRAYVEKIDSGQYDKSDVYRFVDTDSK
jgi:hypothetical protein